MFLFMLVSMSAAAATPRAEISVSLSQKLVRITKVNSRGRVMTISDDMLGVTPGSIKPNVYRVLFSRRPGLEHALVFANSRMIRTTPHFAEMRADGRPVAASIVLAPEFGGILYQTVAKIGVRNVTLVIRP